MATRQLNTLQDLVNATLGQNQWQQGNRYQLNSWTETVWNEPELGKAWKAELQKLDDEAWEVWHAATERWNALSPEERLAAGLEEPKGWWSDAKEFQAKRDEILRRKPGEHNQTRYWLERAGSGGRFRANDREFELSEELGALVAGIWKRAHSKYNYSYAGLLSLKTICERLGKTEIGAELKAKVVAETARQEANARNSKRRDMLKAIAALRREYAELEECTGYHANLDLLTLPVLENVVCAMENVPGGVAE